MKPTIANLWNSRIAPCANCGAGDSKIETLAVMMERQSQALCQELGQQQKDALGKYLACTEEYICLISSQAFSDGFCLASRLMAEAFSEDV